MSVEQTQRMEINKEEYDVFISHASEDKKGFADNLQKELDSRGMKVWYNTMNIQDTEEEPIHE